MGFFSINLFCSCKCLLQQMKWWRPHQNYPYQIESKCCFYIECPFLPKLSYNQTINSLVCRVCSELWQKSNENYLVKYKSLSAQLLSEVTPQNSEWESHRFGVRHLHIHHLYNTNTNINIIFTTQILIQICLRDALTTNLNTNTNTDIFMGCPDKKS